MLISDENPANEVEQELRQPLEFPGLGGRGPAEDPQEDPEKIPEPLISVNEDEVAQSLLDLKDDQERQSQQPKIPLRKGRKSTFNGAQYPDLIPSAKNFLQQNGMDLDLMLRQEKFAVLKTSPDLKKYIRKFLYNEARPARSVAGGLEASTVASHFD
jgi:hypothetical protein